MVNQLGRVVIGGGTGFVGKAVQKAFARKGYKTSVISRRIGHGHDLTWTDLEIGGLPDDTSIVINVAGQNVLDPLRRWTAGFKQNVYASRVHTTTYLTDAIRRAKVKPEVFVSISGVGYYPPSETAEYDESSPGGDFDFLSSLCTDWEGANSLPTQMGVRSVKIRSGVVLGRMGGMIKQLFLPFFLGLGGPVGSGRQYMPWIHINDLADLFVFAVENKKAVGVINGVAPDIITNSKFSKVFAAAMWRPAFIPLPVFVLNLLFSEERAKIMVEGQKVLPKKAMELGFEYNFGSIQKACEDCANLVYIEGGVN